MTRLIAIFAAAMVLAGGAFFALGGPDRTAAIAETPDSSMTITQVSAEAAEGEIVEMQMGNPDAPVTVIEYASYTCPHCATFHAGNFKRLKADYIDTGKINFVYREVYFDRFGLWASMVARCAGPDRFFGITDMLYEDQRAWLVRDAGGQPNPPAIADELRKIGRLAGMENETIEACLQDQEMVTALVGWYQANAEEHGINSTPSFVIDGTTYNNMGYDEMSDLIDEALGEG